jgi:hypothetical protein
LIHTCKTIFLCHLYKKNAFFPIPTWIGCHGNNNWMLNTSPGSLLSASFWGLMLSVFLPLSSLSHCIWSCQPPLHNLAAVCHCLYAQSDSNTHCCFAY